jgi:hypothetical protein
MHDQTNIEFYYKMENEGSDSFTRCIKADKIQNPNKTYMENSYSLFGMFWSLLGGCSA